MLPGAARFSPWKPSTIATPSRLARYGSSPRLSAMRPQRGSRAMSIIGAKVQLTPAAAASSAAMRAPSRTRSGLNVAAWPSGIGSTVRKPWITSRPNSSGTPSRLSSTATRCSSLTTAGSTTFSTAPTLPARMPSRSAIAATPSPPYSWFSWPIFSASVMRPSNASTRRSSVASVSSECSATAVFTGITNAAKAMRRRDRGRQHASSNA